LAGAQKRPEQLSIASAHQPECNRAQEKHDDAGRDPDKQWEWWNPPEEQQGKRRGSERPRHVNRHRQPETSAGQEEQGPPKDDDFACNKGRYHSDSAVSGALLEDWDEHYVERGADH